MKKKLLSALLCVAMVATLVVGCGGSEEPVAETTPVTEEATEEAATVEEAEVVANAEVPNDLDYDATGKKYCFVFKATGNPNGEKQMEGFKKVIFTIRNCNMRNFVIF